MKRSSADFTQHLFLFRQIGQCINSVAHLCACLESPEGLLNDWGGIDVSGGWRDIGERALYGKSRLVFRWPKLKELAMAIREAEVGEKLTVAGSGFEIKGSPNPKNPKFRNFVLYIDEDLQDDVMQVIGFYTDLIKNGPPELLGAFDIVDATGKEVTREQLVARMRYNAEELAGFAKSIGGSRELLDYFLTRTMNCEDELLPAKYWDMNRIWGGICLTKGRIEDDYDNWHAILRCVVDDNKEGLDNLLQEMNVPRQSREKCIRAIFYHRNTVLSWNWLIREMTVLYEHCRGLTFMPRNTKRGGKELKQAQEIGHSFMIARGEGGGGWLYCNRLLAIWLLKVMLLGYFIKIGEYAKAGSVLAFDPQTDIVSDVAAQQQATMILTNISPGWSGKIVEECARILAFTRVVCLPGEMGDISLI